MKAIRDYTIYCTEEQTKKALELGAPINLGYHINDFENSVRIRNLCYAELPTAEQMIGFIEDNTIVKRVNVYRGANDKYYWSIHTWTVVDACPHVPDGGYSSRPEATIAAIDAALEYLSNNKK